MKKLVRILMSATMAAALSAGASTGSSAAASSEAPAASTEAAETSAAAAEEGKTYKIGIVQLVQHPALDAATKGFEDEVKAKLGNVEFDEQNASGDSATASQIANSFVTEGVDLIMANATPALQASAAATNTIPILGTSVTEYGTALSIDNFSGTVGGNISGTSDLAPLDQQAAMFDELLPDAKNIGILYCNAEANSVYQANVVQAALESAGKTVTVYTFTDTNDVQSVTQKACSESEALYIPTDNTAASCADVIDSVAEAANIPIICGEEGIMSGCGIATLSIDYYELGKTTGDMAVRILKDGEDISTMPIEYYQNPVKEYMKDRCEKYGITVPDDYTEYKAE